MSWTAPEPADPTAIITSARTDTDEGRHADALAKFLWFHHNALRCNPCLSGVRLTYALSGWARLAGRYPPARDALLRTRDEAEAAHAAAPTDFRLFSDFACLNRALGDWSRTADAFAAFAEREPVAAARLYRAAEPALIATGRYAECGPYLDPPRRLRVTGEEYRAMARHEGPSESGPPPRAARVYYGRDIATLVGLLVLTRRPEDADWVRERALAVVDGEEVRALLDEAMAGRLPPVFAP